MTKRLRTLVTAVQSVLIIVMMILVAAMITQISHLQGTARVINYAGLVRGATQREIKLEIAGQKDDDLIVYLDEIIYGLKFESPKYNLVKLDDADYLDKLDVQIDYWQQVKKEIYNVRTVGYQATDIVEMSEQYFHMADDTVSAAEQYSEAIAERIRYLELGTIVDIVLLLCIMLGKSVDAVLVRRKNKQLEQKAFIDEPTGLPNKGRCEQFFTDAQPMEKPLTCVVFDLNNLKKANDTLGHSVGDQLIANFARLLRNAIPTPHFVGRYGGDEFMAVIYGASKQEVENILNNLHEDVSEFNQLHHGNNGFVDVSYAYGWSISEDLPDCSFRVLFDKADKNMYENKMKNKQHRR